MYTSKDKNSFFLVLQKSDPFYRLISCIIYKFGSPKIQ